MFKSDAIKFEQFFELPNQGLRAYFNNVVKGQSKVFDTPFAKGEKTEDLLNHWQNILESINDEWPTLFDFEMDMKGKVGPLSVMKPLEERITDIDAYYEGVVGPAEPLNDSAIKAVLHEWAPARGSHVRSQRLTLDRMKKSSNSGSPFFTKRRNVIDNTYPVKAVFSRGDIVYQSLNDKQHSMWYAAAVLGWRGQEGGISDDEVKQRVVWMFPFAVNLEELRVYQPLIETAQRFDLVPAWVSMDSVDSHITQLFDSKGAEDFVICTDFTKFDQHFNESLQDAARTMIAGVLTPNKDAEGWIRDIFPVKFMIPLAYDWGKVRYGKHGMGSGSGGTNFDETLAHRALQYESALNQGKRLNPHSMCLGDDGLLTYPGIDVDAVIADYTKHGLEMNSDKQYVSKQDCIYLRRWHHASYRINGICAGVYSTMRALGRLRYLERFYDPEVWGPKMVALRQLSIIENVKNHPLRNEFADFCMERDKFRLGIDIPGFLDNIEVEAKKAIDQLPDFLGYTKTMQADAQGLGIQSWWIVNYLKSKR